jgi:hypothetical protein
MRKVAKREPVISAAVVADPVQVRLALRVVPPDIARLLITVERMYEIPSVSLPTQAQLNVRCRAVYYSASQCANISHQVFSFFMKFLRISLCLKP